MEIIIVDFSHPPTKYEANRLRLVWDSFELCFMLPLSKESESFKTEFVSLMILAQMIPSVYKNKYLKPGK